MDCIPKFVYDIDVGGFTYANIESVSYSEFSYDGGSKTYIPTEHGTSHSVLAGVENGLKVLITNVPGYLWTCGSVETQNLVVANSPFGIQRHIDGMDICNAAYKTRFFGCVQLHISAIVLNP